MFYISEPLKSAPVAFKTALQQKVYSTLEELAIPFERVDCDEAISMQDCILIDEKLDMKTVKTLFLCNRQQTAFYLFITTADKPFSTKDFSAALGVSRVSFASETLLLEKLGVKTGAATVFGLLLDTAAEVKLVMDKAILSEEWYGCSDGTTTGYMKLRMEDLIQTLLPFTRHEPLMIEI